MTGTGVVGPASARRCALLGGMVALVGVLAVVPAYAAASAEFRPSLRPVRLGAPRSLHLHARRVCPQGPCQALVLVRPDGSTGVTPDTPPFYLTPALLHQYYQLPADSAASTPPTIAVIEEGDDPTAEADLNTYSMDYGLPSCTSTSTPQCFYKYNGSASGNTYTPGVGGTTYDDSNAGDRELAAETALDLEAAHATCDNCRLMLVEVNVSAATTQNEGLDDLAPAVEWAGQNGGPGGSGAAVISNSYEFGGASFTMPLTTDAAYTDYDQPGHVIVASSGDNGYFSTPNYPAYPLTNPNVVAVGGTSLSATTDGFYAGETVWNDSSGSSGLAQRELRWSLVAGR